MLSAIRSLTFLAVCGLLAGLTGCGKGDPLEYPAAMNLLRDNNTASLTMRFSASPPLDRTTAAQVLKAYDVLKENHILDCSEPEKGNLCVPGAAGGAIQQDTATALLLTAGHWTPLTIISMERTSRTSATAQVRMAFEPSSLYRDYENSFDALRTAGSSRDLDQKKDGKTMTASFQRYDDGWHLEGLQ
jgi:hypothetical protein